MQQGREPLGFQEDQQNVLFKLQSDLLQTWSSLHVQEYYQNLVLNYLDTLPSYKVQQHISKEIKASNEGKSPYFKLSTNLTSRKQSLSALQSLIKRQNKPQPDSQSLTSICSLLSCLRDSNLLFAQTLIQLLKQYSMNDEPVTDQCMQMFQNLDEDNRFLKESFLKQYVLFKEQYDPFFLHHYDMKGKKAAKRESEIIDHLFTLSLSYVCRLLKANNQIVDIVKEGKMTPVDHLESRLHSRRMSDDVNRRKKSKAGPETLVQEKRTIANGFRRRHFSLNQPKEKFEESRSSFFKRQESKRRNTVETAKQEESQPLSPKKAQGFLQTPFRRQLKTDSNEGRFVPQNFRIKPIHPKQPFEQQPNKSTITIEQQKPSAFRRKFINIRNRLNPLKHFKKIYHQPGNQEEAEKIPVSKDKPLCKFSIARFPPAIQQTQSQDKSQERKSSPRQQSSKKEIKLRPGKYQLPQLLKLLKKLAFKKRPTDSLEQPLRKHQSYVSEFLLDEELVILALSLVLSPQTYLIKLWGTLESCSEQTSALLFKKYLDYLQKMTQLAEIHFQGEYAQEMEGTGFQKMRENYYVRRRFGKTALRIAEFQPFLSLKCSNIVIKQQNPQARLLYSEDIQAFSQENAYGSRELVMIDKDRLNSDVKMLAKISEGIDNMKTLNVLLQDQNLDTFEVHSKAKIGDIRALRINFHTAFIGPFIASDGYLKLNGEAVYSSDKAVICSARCSKNNAKLYLGKGLKNLSHFRQNLSKKGKQCNFSVKMFSKQLYGRMEFQGCCYGYWEINLSWQDELQGKTRHPMTNCQHFGPESFFVGVQLERELVYCFTVDDKDFLL